LEKLFFKTPKLRFRPLIGSECGYTVGKAVRGVHSSLLSVRRSRVNVGILLFDEVEVLDFAGPFEVFSVTSELNDYRLLRVHTISKDGGLVTAVNGLKVQPEYSFNDHPPIDILVIPGGVGTRREMADPKVLDWVLANHSTARITFSVCSGARILGKLGLLDGMASTTHHEVIPHLQEIAPATRVNPEARFIDAGKVMTCGGITAGIDLSLHIVGKLFGEAIRRKTVTYMEYGDWRSSMEEGVAAFPVAGAAVPGS
jgi:transcriptional regulator GlxA family with amidase domain